MNVKDMNLFFLEVSFFFETPTTAPTDSYLSDLRALSCVFTSKMIIVNAEEKKHFLEVIFFLKRRRQLRPIHTFGPSGFVVRFYQQNDNSFDR